MDRINGLKMKFVVAVDNEWYNLAADILSDIFDYYKENNFESEQQRKEFRIVVKWFVQEVHRKGGRTK